MMQAEALALCQLFPEGAVIFIKIEESVQIACVFLFKIIADIAALFLFPDPGGNRIFLRRLSLQLIHKGSFPGSEVGELILHFRNQFLVMGF